MQDNIEAFGGDPSKVTVFGESAGAVSVISHLSSPQSKGLYRQAIVESGPFLTNKTFVKLIIPRAEAEKRGVEFAQILGYSGSDAISQMRNRSAWDLINATPSINGSTFWEYRELYFVPTVDGWFFQEAPEEVFGQGQQDAVSLIIGDNADEGLSFIAGLNLTVPEYEQYIRDNYGENASQILAKYPASTPEEIAQQMAKIITAYDFDKATRFGAISMAGLNQSTYVYRFTHVPAGIPGAIHGVELPFVFGTGAVFNFNQTDDMVSNNTMDYWVNFVKTGDPNKGMNVTWPKYTAEKGQYLDIGEIPVAKTGY